MREWRRGRADASLGEALEGAYVGLFAAAMLIAIAISVLRGLGDLVDTGCDAGCLGARALAPPAVALGLLGLALALARLVGPVFVNPAVASWLLSSPVDRGGLLRPRAVAGLVGSSLVLGVLAAASATLAGWPLVAGVTLTVATTVVALAALAGAVRAQASGWRAPARALASAPSLAAWLLLVVMAAGMVAGADPDDVPGWVVVLPVVVVPVAALALGAAVRALPRLPRARVARAGSLVPAVSGALATLDLSLAWDVVTEHRWRGRGAVRPRRGRWTGSAALVHADLVRLRRSPARLLRLAMAAVVPLATRAAGVGAVNVVVVGLVGFVAALPLLSSLRVLERSPGLARMLPFGTPAARAAAVAVPLVVLAIWGVALVPALPPVDGRPLIALAAGVSATASAVRWMTGRPPDYGRPLVSTPAGGVPTNLYGSLVRGFDILLITLAPVLISSSGTGALWSIALSAVVLSYLLGRADGKTTSSA